MLVMFAPSQPQAHHPAQGPQVAQPVHDQVSLTSSDELHNTVMYNCNHPPHHTTVSVLHGSVCRLQPAPLLSPNWRMQLLGILLPLSCWVRFMCMLRVRSRSCLLPIVTGAWPALFCVQCAAREGW
jgi:hypothetical protein